MNNEIDKDNESYESPSIEVKEGFFSKLFNSFRRQALPPGDGAVKTNVSMSSLMARGSLRATLINLGNKIQNVFTPKKEVTPKSTLSAHVIGDNKSKDENAIDKTKADDESVLSAEQPRVFIPQNKTAVASRATTVMNENPEPKLEVADMDTESIIDATELEFDDSMIVEDDKNLTNNNNIQPVDMTFDENSLKDPKTPETKTNEGREQDR